MDISPNNFRKKIELDDIVNLIDATEIRLDHKPNLDSLCPNYPMSNNCTTLLIGAKGSGKSYVLSEIFNKNKFDIIFFISPTAAIDQTHKENPFTCQYSIDFDEPNEGVDAVYEYLYKRILIKYYLNLYNEVDPRDTETVDELWNSIEQTCGDLPIDFFNINHRVAVTLDDCGYHTNQMTQNQSPIEKLNLINRHLAPSIIIALQRYTQVNPTIRSNTTDLVLTANICRDDLRSIYNTFPNIPRLDLIGQPQNFIAIFEQLKKGHKYASLHLLREGVYFNFEKINPDIEYPKLIKQHKEEKSKAF